MNTFIISNNTNGSYKTPSLSIANNSTTIQIVSIFVDKSFYTDNASKSLICVHSKQLSKNLTVQNNKGLSTEIFSFGVNGVGTENVIVNPKILLYFSRPTHIVNFDDIELKDINGTLLDLTTSQVRFQIIISAW